MSNTPGLEELKNPALVSSIENLQHHVDIVERVLLNLCENNPEEVYKKLDAAGKAQLDTFLAYALNSLFWVYLKTQGRDPTSHSVKSELTRIRDHMNRAKQLQDRALAPRLDTGVAERFIRGGLWTPKDKESSGQEGTGSLSSQGTSRSRKRKHDPDPDV